MTKGRNQESPMRIAAWIAFFLAALFAYILYTITIGL